MQLCLPSENPAADQREVYQLSSCSWNKKKKKTLNDGQHGSVQIRRSGETGITAQTAAISFSHAASLGSGETLDAGTLETNLENWLGPSSRCNVGVWRLMEEDVGGWGGQRSEE